MTDWEPIESLAHHPELQVEELVKTLRMLVSTVSVSPGATEQQVAERIAAALTGTGCEITFVTSMPGRPSLAAVLRGSRGSPRLVLNGHMDTVPIDDRSLWKVDPFAGEVKDGALWGRGAVDMKAGLTAQIACARVLGSLHRRLRGTLVLHFAAGEEFGEPGTLSLIERGFVGDFGIVTEPTNLHLAIAQRGVARYRIVIGGRSSHASSPDNGLNPLSRLPALLTALERYDRNIRERGAHPLLPPTTCTPTIVSGGVAENAVPDSCELIVDRRILPGETPDGVLSELRQLVSTLAGADPRFTWSVELHGKPFEPSQTTGDSPFAELILRTGEAVTGTRPKIIGTPYASDVRNLINDAKMEAVTFGPGDVTMCHCPNEHVSLVAVRQAAIVCTKVAIDLLS